MQCTAAERSDNNDRTPVCDAPESQQALHLQALPPVSKLLTGGRELLAFKGVVVPQPATLQLLLKYSKLRIAHRPDIWSF